MRASDADVKQLSHTANQYHHDIKAVLNLTVSEDDADRRRAGIAR